MTEKILQSTATYCKINHKYIVMNFTIIPESDAYCCLSEKIAAQGVLMRILDAIDHRPWPLPRGRAIMVQTWHDLLFAHWPVPAYLLYDKIPKGVELDTFGGTAWLGVIAFQLSDVRLNGIRAVPWVSNFPEVNVRTYVTHDSKPGVFFLSLDADNPLGITLAKPWFRLNYYRAQIEMKMRGDGIDFSSRRTQRGASSAQFEASYRPCGPAFRAQRGSLEAWLTERYCYYTAPRDAHKGRLYRCEIHHLPWRLQMAQATICSNTMALSHGIELPATEPLLHHARKMQALIWPLRRC